MKRELSSLFQFSLIVLMAGFGFFGITILLNMSNMSLWPEHKNLMANWIIAFLFLSTLRLGLNRLKDRLRISVFAPRRVDINMKVNEVWTTFHYIALATVSLIISFIIPILAVNDDGLSINLLEVWLGVRPLCLSWLSGFIILSLIRLGIIHAVQKV